MKTTLPLVMALLAGVTSSSVALDFVTATVAPGAVPFSGWGGIVGTRFGVQASEIPAGSQVKVTHLGFFAGVAGQFAGAGVVDVAHNVTLHGPQFFPGRQGDYSALLVASAAVPIGNPVDANGWSWVELPSPVILQGGGYYVVAVDNVTNALDPYFDPNQGVAIPPPENYTPVIVAPNVIFKNGAPNTDGFMRGRYGLGAGQEAFDASGYLGASFQYTLDTAPVISTDLPATTLVTAGGSTTLSVALNPAGFPDAATYLWEHDPLPIDGTWVTVGTDPSYFIGFASTSDAGNYRVTVTNSIGTDQSTGSLVVDPDTDGDGLGDSVETNTGTYVSPGDTGTDPNVLDTDADGLGDGREVFTYNTNPHIKDTDVDGLDDGPEVDVHFTVPTNADTDGDGVNDGPEVDVHFSSPLSVDTDLDGYWDGNEVNGTPSSSPVDPDSPGGPNPAAIAVSFNNQAGEVTGYGLSPLMYAGVPAVRQKNWNRTNPLGFPATGSETSVASPSAGVLVDSAGNPTTMTMSFSGVGAWADDNEDRTPYGRLYSAFVYNDNVNRDVEISLGNIPYAFYDVYVYMGAAANGFRGTVSSGSTIYSFTTSSNATSGGALGVDVYTETTSPAGFPQANYCVFRNVSGPSFSFKASHDNLNAGVFGFQVVQKTATPYQAWAASKGLDPNTNGAPGFDADFDGFDNLLEYALFTEPASGSSLPVFVPVTAGGNLSLTYNRAKSASDVIFTAQWSANLVDWFVTGLTDLPTGNETVETVERQVTVAKDGAQAKFLRVVVTHP